MSRVGIAWDCPPKDASVSRARKFFWWLEDVVSLGLQMVGLITVLALLFFSIFVS